MASKVDLKEMATRYLNKHVQPPLKHVKSEPSEQERFNVPTGVPITHQHQPKVTVAYNVPSHSTQGSAPNHRLHPLNKKRKLVVLHEELKLQQRTNGTNFARKKITPKGISNSTNSNVDSNGNDSKSGLDRLRGPDGQLPQRIRNIDPTLILRIMDEIVSQHINVRWHDIAGLEHAKKCVTETIVWPLLRPDIFTGVRSAGRGLLLFGPPGTGKSMIGKAIAGEVNATFFNISASSLVSKWVGEAENLVRALFEVASCFQPAVIFFDEIDSLLSKRGKRHEHEFTRRIKTQFFLEMEGICNGNEQILLIGATNRPQDLDEAARRRLAKRLYIPLPSTEARGYIVDRLLEKDGLLQLSDDDMDIICYLTEGFSGSDMKNLVKDASLGPLRDAIKNGMEIRKLKLEDLRPITLQDFKNSLEVIRPSVSANELDGYVEWNKEFGSLSL